MYIKRADHNKSRDIMIRDDIGGTFLERVGQLRSEEKLLDFTISVGDKQIRAHRIVLAAYSDYFKAMLTCQTAENLEGKVNLKDVDQETIEAIVDFCYSGKLELTETNVYQILLAASRFQFKAAQDTCEEFLKANLSISLSKCLEVAVLSKNYNLFELCDKALDICLERFRDVVKEKEFLDLDADFMTKIISDVRLNVEDELDVFKAVVKWTEADKENRRCKFDEIISHVQFASIGTLDLADISSIDLVRESLTCMLLVDAAKTIVMLKDYPELYQKHISQLNIKPRINGQQRLYAFGGWDQDYNFTTSAEVYNPRIDTWSDISPMTQNLCGVGMTVLNNHIYAVGGRGPGNYLDSVERYDVDKKIWFKDVAKMKLARINAGVVTLNGHIYVIGGEISGATVTDKVEKYDPISNTWTDCAPLQRQRFAVGVAVWDNHIYVIGGGGAERGSSKQSVERYDPKKDTWKYVASMNVPRRHLGSCTYQGKIYAVGGLNDSEELNSAEAYDPELDKWTNVRSMKIHRHGFGLLELAGRLYAVGGQSNYRRLSDVEAYDPKTDTWATRKHMNHERLSGGMVVHPTRGF